MSIVPNSQRTHEQLSEMGRKGGILSRIDIAIVDGKKVPVTKEEH